MHDAAMRIAYDQLTDEEISAHSKHLDILPSLLKQDTLKGIAIGKIIGTKPGLVIATSTRLAYIYRGGLKKEWPYHYHEIASLAYEGDKLLGRKKKGLVKDFSIDILSDQPFGLLDALCQYISVAGYTPVAREDSSEPEYPRDSDLMPLHEVQGRIHDLNSEATFEKLETKPEVMRLRDTLYRDEEILAVLYGIGGEVGTANKIGRKLLVCTGQRMLMVDGKGAIREYHLDTVVDAAYTKKFLNHEVTFRTSSDRRIEISETEQKRAIRFVSLLQDLIKKKGDLPKSLRISQQLDATGIQLKASWVKGEITYLPDVLDDSENIIAAMSGRLNNNQWLIVCTERRIVCLDKGFVELKQRDIPLARISSISSREGVFGGNVDISEIGGQVMLFGSVPPGEARKFADAANRALEDRAQPNYGTVPASPTSSVATPAHQVDVVEQLKKFAELRDMGILTEDEFQAQKEKLLQL